MNLLDILEREDSVSIVTVFRREVVTKVGAFNETLRRTEDYDLWVRAAAAYDKRRQRSRSNLSLSMTFTQAATKACTKRSVASALA